MSEYGEENSLTRSPSSGVLLWRNKHAPHVGLPMNHVNGRVFRVFLPLEPLVGAVQPLHLECADRDAVADDHQLIDAFLVVITMKGAECLMNPDGDVEPALSQRHSCPEFPLEFDLFVVVRSLVREDIRQVFFRNAIEKAELLLHQVDVLPTIEVQLVTMTLIGFRCHRFNAADEFVGGLSRSCIWRDPESGFRVVRIVVQEVLAKPFPGSVRLLPSHLGERYRMVRQFQMLPLVDIAGRLPVTYEK